MGQSNRRSKARMGGQHRLLLLCSLMGLARGQSAALRTTPTPVTPSPGCWYEALCAYSDDSYIKLAIPSPHNADLESRMQWCYNQCRFGYGEATCTDFSVQSIGIRSHSCYLLTNCNEKSTDANCLSLGSCNSGPKDCASNNNCDILASPPPADTIPWECDHDVNPYVQQVPEGTECFISCNAWLDDNKNQASIVSKCVAGAWQASVTNETIDYDPNTLPGTDFLCTGADYITSDGINLKFALQPGMTCRMFCDNYHIATMTCVNGLWTGEPELGAWCYAEPDTADDMGAGTVGPTSTTTAAPTSPTGA